MLECLVVFTLFLETCSPISGKNKMADIENKEDNLRSMCE